MRRFQKIDDFVTEIVTAAIAKGMHGPSVVDKVKTAATLLPNTTFDPVDGNTYVDPEDAVKVLTDILKPFLRPPSWRPEDPGRDVDLSFGSDGSDPNSAARRRAVASAVVPDGNTTAAQASVKDPLPPSLTGSFAFDDPDRGPTTQPTSDAFASRNPAFQAATRSAPTPAPSFASAPPTVRKASVHLGPTGAPVGTATRDEIRAHAAMTIAKATRPPAPVAKAVTPVPVAKAAPTIRIVKAI